MNKLFFIILFLLFIPNGLCKSDMNKFVMEKPDGTIKIITYMTGSKDTIADVMRSQAELSKVDVNECTIVPIEDNEIPETQEGRKYWRLNKIGIGNKILIDEIAKQADLAAEAEKKAKKGAALLKLKITEQDLKEVLYGEKLSALGK